MKKIIYNLVALVVVVLLFVFFPISEKNESPENAVNYKAEIVKIVSESPDTDTQVLEVQFNEGENAGHNIDVTEDSSVLSVPREFKAGDKVILTGYTSENGETFYYILDFQRQNVLLWLFVVFVVLVLAITGNQGAGSLIGMVFSFWVIFKIILPSILAGGSAIWAAVMGILVIVPATFYLGHGINKKTTIAGVSTIVTLIGIGLMAKYFAGIGNLSGLSSEEINFLKLDTLMNIDVRGLVVAGMIIGILGILDDVTISQASVVQELKSANKKMGFWELFASAMRVGRDHISSMVNTLVLIYAGSYMPLLLLFIDRSRAFIEVLNYEFVAEQIIATLVGSIGLVLAVPITTFFAALFLSKDAPKDLHGHSHSH
ncbi:MAG: YibE/F family protein [Patescibacteria group bacterium]